MKEYKKLHAEWYDLVSAGGDHQEEIDFFARSIDASSQPILELGSGTGRILIPLLEQGFDISGIDTSEDMLDRCRAACKAKGLKAELYAQSMLDFELPQTFGLILLTSGGLGLFTRNQDIRSTFKQVMAHLKPGGVFIFEFEPVPAEYGKNSGHWTGDWANGPDDVVIAKRQSNKYDSTTHIWERLVIFDKFANGRLIETEANERTGRFFTVEEAVQFAKSAGFEEIKATNWLTEEPPSNESKVVTVHCRKRR
jgi:SAM-dependent methyltransferase